MYPGYLASNSEVMATILTKDRFSNLEVEFEENDFGLAGSLGLEWHTVRDTLFCKIKDSRYRNRMKSA